MTPCARSCCWTPFSCATDRSCACHWDERKGYTPTLKGGADATYSDPTARTAIYNIERERRGK